MAVWAGTPGSDPANGQWVGGEVAPGPEHLVLWKLPGAAGVYGTCIDARVAGPLHGPYRRTQVIKDAVYGELNHLYASASTSDVRLAELSALNSAAYDRVDRGAQWSYVVNRLGGTSVADASAMLDHARQLAGPYIVTIALPQGVRAGATFTATVSVRSAQNNMVPGATVSFSATNATLRASSAKTDSIGRARVSFPVPRGTTTTYSLRASVQSWTNVSIYSAPGEQTMLSAGPPTTQASAKTGAIVRDRAVSLVKAAADDPAHTPVPGYTYRITDATGAVVIPSVVSGTTPVDLGRLTMGATYTATEIAGPPGGPLYVPVKNTLEFTVPDGSAVWTLLAQDPRMPTPSLATQVTSERAVVGQSLTDVVTVTGNDGENGTIDAVLHGPVPTPRSGGCAAVTLAAYEAARATHVTAVLDGSVNSGNGDVRVTSPPVTAPGCYGWAETLTLQPSGAKASSPPTAPHESTLVTKPPVQVNVVPPPGRVTTPPMTAPPATTPPHRPNASAPPELAQTGAPIPVVRTVLLGLGLIALGSSAMVATGRRGRRWRTT